VIEAAAPGGGPAPSGGDEPAGEAASPGWRRWLATITAGLLAVAVIEAVAIAWLWSRPAGRPLSGEGELVIQSRPAAARVAIDGEERGTTPLTLTLPAGTHVLELRAGTTSPRVIPLTIRAGVQTAQYVELQEPAMAPPSAVSRRQGRGDSATGR
jgi:hypothetical protein